LTEEELIRKCLEGDLQSFGRLVEKASPEAFSVAFRILCDEDEAEDIVQETMITVWRKLKSLSSSASFKTWMFRIVVNKCYDRLRKMKRNPEFRPDERTWKKISGLNVTAAGEELENEENARVINALTHKLSPRQKTVFVLSEIEALTGDEIAEITGMNKKVIKSNLWHARRNIAAMLDKYL